MQIGPKADSRSKKRQKITTRNFVPMSEINVTPFVDIMLVLLIIFMVAAPLLSVGIEVDLPNTKAKPLVIEKERPLTLTLDGDDNIFINEDTGYAYAVGTSTCGPGGLHIVDISTPSLPSKSACVSDPNVGNERGRIGYNHDVQCVVYNGPDTAFVGKEICFGSNETYVWITDVSVKSEDNSGAKTISL
jgi:hypothetical protein